MSCSADDGTAHPDLANIPAETAQNVNSDGSRLLVGRDRRSAVARRGRITLAALYAIQVFYSFFIMWVHLLSGCSRETRTDHLTRLLFMTYNGLIMIAVAVGAFFGYLIFSDDTPAAKTIACH